MHIRPGLDHERIEHIYHASVAVDAQFAVASVGLEIALVRAGMRAGLADRALRQNLAALLVQPLSERGQKRHPVALSERTTCLR